MFSFSWIASSIKGVSSDKKGNVSGIARIEEAPRDKHEASCHE
jgi:hypothetical protein